MKTIIMNILIAVAVIGSFAILIISIAAHEIGKFCDDIMGDDIW